MIRRRSVRRDLVTGTCAGELRLSGGPESTVYGGSQVKRKTVRSLLCVRALVALAALSLITAPVQAQPGWVLSHQKISDTQGGFTGTLDNAILSGNRSNLAFTGRHFRQNRSSVLTSGRDSLRRQHRRRQIGNPGLRRTS